ncbi:MAG: excinuclease ABC subunit A [Candidatus Zambryskibacteria bacterium RIFCSPLOWO2_01_FULL_42_41]|nr:MAG: excinuclease ABC subunit A [Candidatus Zambryskibacteria bacterium RIFCSPHIGHO2_01_FULL_43_60]OHB02819.1 MAG: excinuclease ABC subunit A [Candidatus Zambryskibacteria bacterium RIFCSPLOWO2_01_FULL_42_41]
MNKKNLKEDLIVVRGARTHNLKNITVEMPRNKMIAFTGLSGSGKSSLAFDTIFAEGQRRYVESLSSYARQFLRQMQKPDVDEIIGLSPAISIDQKSRSNNPRSTVATITEIYDYLRILYARIGRPHCLVCGAEIKKLSNEEIKNFILERMSRVTLDILDIEIWSPIVRGRKGEYYQLLYDLLGKGYSEVMVDGKRYSLRERIALTKTKKHEISVLVDSINLKEESADERLSEAIEKAIHESDGLLVLRLGEEEHLLSAKWACPKDGFSFPEIEPRLFSFNSPYGACPDCNGLGTKYLFGSEPCERCHGSRLRAETLNILIGNKNIVELTALSIKDCDEFFSALQIGGSASGGKKLTIREKNISKVITKEIEARLSFMLDVGIDYLSLDRKAHTLSGGEAQRIRLASQLGSGLVGALYVLDEPTIGLHARDNARLIKTLLNLRDLGNTIIVVEHDEETIYSSDYLVDIGPGAGVHGGEIVVAGDLNELLLEKKNESKSLTLAYLRGEKSIEIPGKRRVAEKGKIAIRAGKIFNIKHMNVDIPLGQLVVVTGVSGSGKSSFVYEILHKNLLARLDRRYRNAKIFNCQSFTGSEYLGRVISVDQSPIGRTPRSNPATYTGAFTFIRELFAETVEARARGWKANRFSFNVKGGRCETCQGNGMIEVEMHFLPTVYVPCDVCLGKRFMKETLEVKYNHKNIYNVLEMTVEEALVFFEDIPAIYDRLKSLNDVGLGYLALGQSATTLSGGEAQRVKIASELYRPHLQKTIYLLDEPTIGLHYEDVKKLIEILQKLVDKGNTVVVIEHNLDFIKSADYVLDIGPEAGDEGGKLVAQGTPEEVANTDTHTGKYLRKILRKK